MTMTPEVGTTRISRATQLKRRISRLVFVPVVAALAISTVSLVSTAAPAGAVTVTGSNIGLVSEGPVVASQAGYGMYNRYIQVSGTIVNRSPNYSGTQVVTVTNYIYQYSSCTDYPACPDGTPYAGHRWTLATYNQNSVAVPAGQHAQFTASNFNFGPSYLNTQIAPYTVVTYVQWKTTTGSVFASQAIYFNAYNDYITTGLASHQLAGNGTTWGVAFG
jgi:hypothetical protein